MADSRWCCVWLDWRMRQVVKVGDGLGIIASSGTTLQQIKRQG